MPIQSSAHKCGYCDEFFPPTEADEHIRACEKHPLAAAVKALEAHKKFVKRLGEFMDLQGTLGYSMDAPNRNRYSELFQHILTLREKILEKPGFYR